MPDRLPSLIALRAFEAAARHAHFGRAGDELHVTHSAISRQIRTLEAELGVDLFERRNRAVFLTDAGKRLLESTRLSFRQIAETAAELREGMPMPLVVSCEPTLTQRWLIPRLPAFHALHPDVMIGLKAAGGPVTLGRDKIDCAIRRSDFNWVPDIHAETVLAERVGPVCTPHMASKLSRESLLLQPRIHSLTRVDAWDRWAADSNISLPDTQSRSFEHFYLSLEAATAGLGVAIGPEPLVIDAIATGRLTAPFGFRSNGFRYVLLSQDPVKQDSRKQKFLNWLHKEAEAFIT